MLRFEVLIINQSQSNSLKLIEYTVFLKERMLLKILDDFRGKPKKIGVYKKFTTSFDLHI